MEDSTQPSRTRRRRGSFLTVRNSWKGKWSEQQSGYASANMSSCSLELESAPGEWEQLGPSSPLLQLYSCTLRPSAFAAKRLK